MHDGVGMKTGTKIAIGVGAAFGLLVLLFLGSIFSFRSSAVSAEAGVKAQYKQNQNNYDNMWKKFRELSQVPQNYADDLKKVYDSAIQGRYGSSGSQATVQWIKEHNPTFDSSLYGKIQAAIEAGRNGFEADQKMLIDKKREYEVLLNGNTALYANVWGFPKIDLDQYDIVTSETTDTAFKSKKADEVKLR